MITPASRAKIVQWLYDCVDYLELQRDCVAVAMSYVDRFMSRCSGADGFASSGSSSGNQRKMRAVVFEAQRDATVYQLVAAKRDDVRACVAIDASVLARISHGSYSHHEILSMERTLLAGLGWRICGPTASEAADHAVALLARWLRRRHRDTRLSSVADFVRLQIELSVADYDASALRRPTTMALAAYVDTRLISTSGHIL